MKHLPPLETQAEELKRYVDFSAEDAALLRSFHPVAAPHFERIAQEFYDRIRRHEEAHAVFTGEAQIARLQRSLVAWMHRLFGGQYDEQYFADIAKIGRIHVKVGLPQRYMFTAMALIRTSLTQIAERDRPDGAAVSATLSRLLDVELAVMLESYRDDFVARLQHIERLERDALGASLARTEHRYVNAVELAQVLIVGLDGAGTIRLFNREAERVTGFARDEVLGTRIVEQLGIDMFVPDAWTADPHGEPKFAAPLETAVRTRSGNTRIVLWQLSHAPSQGDEVCMFALGRDITDEKALHARTQQQEKLAAIGTLAAGLAHEIRNPLNGAQLHVTYLSRSLKKANANPELVDTVAVVADEIARLGTLVTEFLAFARPRPLQIRPVTVQALLGRVSQLAPAGEHATAIVLDVPGAAIELQADAAKLEQVLLNLTQNAVDAIAGAAGGQVVLRARRQPRTVTIEVEDNGPGIAAGTPVFDAFFSTKPQGTGLGLSISHRIVTDHGGTLDVDSRGGRTIFRVVLPIDGPPAMDRMPSSGA
ncbi:MAG TPA: protoglobin domain-containing protein [Nannocystis sp.]|jgi:PAS domain S-box-containing protein